MLDEAVHMMRKNERQRTGHFREEVLNLSVMR